MTLLVVETHPVQYHAPVYRDLARRFDLPVHVCYGSRHGIDGSLDPEFGVRRRWDVDLLEGYSSEFLCDGARSVNSTLMARVDQVLAAGPSAILIPGYAQPLERLAILISRLRGLPIVFRGEASDHAVSRGRIKRLVRDLALRAFYGSADAFAAIGIRARMHYLRLGVAPSKIAWSPYCVDNAPFNCDPGEAERRRLRREVRESIGIPESAFVILFSGKLSERKGPDLILAAVGSLSPEVRRRFGVLFVGEGAMRTTLEEVGRGLGVQFVRFAGFVNQTQLSPYFHASDALCLPSRRGETWGLVINEALMHGLPVVVTPGVGCADDLVIPEVTGVIARSASVEALATAIVDVERLSAKTTCASDCRSVVAEYSVDRAAAGIYEALRIAVS